MTWEFSDEGCEISDGVKGFLIMFKVKCSVEGYSSLFPFFKDAESWSFLKEEDVLRSLYEVSDASNSFDEVLFALNRGDLSKMLATIS